MECLEQEDGTYAFEHIHWFYHRRVRGLVHAYYEEYCREWDLGLWYHLASRGRLYELRVGIETR